MPEPVCLPQRVCASDELIEAGDAVVFDVLEFGRPASAFVLRHQQKPVAYLNRCAHVPAEMDWQPGKFWDMDRRFIICSVHGALYDPPSGVCVSGPCRGKRLQTVEVEEREGVVYWYPSTHIQPVPA